MGGACDWDGKNKVCVRDVMSKKILEDVHL
jgi:hypothetical protein